MVISRLPVADVLRIQLSPQNAANSDQGPDASVPDDDYIQQPIIYQDRFQTQPGKPMLPALSTRTLNPFVS
jgi:hypothetical protein